MALRSSGEIAAENLRRESERLRAERRRAFQRDLEGPGITFDQERSDEDPEQGARRVLAQSEHDLASILAQAGRAEAARRAAKAGG